MLAACLTCNVLIVNYLYYTVFSISYFCVWFDLDHSKWLDGDVTQKHRWPSRLYTNISQQCSCPFLQFCLQFTVLRCCVAEQRMFRGSSSSVLFHFMLLLGLLMAATTLGFNIYQQEATPDKYMHSHTGRLNFLKVSFFAPHLFL